MILFPFEEADTNNNGHLTKKEVKEALSKGPGNKEMISSFLHFAVNNFFTAADSDKDGKITKKEFDQAHHKVNKKLEEIQKQMLGLFKKKEGGWEKVDKDGDDYVTKEEFKDVYKVDLGALLVKASPGKMPDGKVSKYHAT